MPPIRCDPSLQMSPSPLQRKFTLDLLTEWRSLALPFAEAPVVLAVSGGADSCALAVGVSDLVRRGKLKGRIVVGHFDHGIREESGDDAVFVRSLAERLGFGFEEGSPGSEELRGSSNLEAKARILRYRFLLDVAMQTGAQHVLTAHTVNDQAETLLLNLIRGSGLKGLSGMDRKIPIGTILSSEDSTELEEPSGAEVMLCRPLLRWATREMTVAYTEESGVSGRIDAMNSDLTFQRVRVRNEVIPLLKELNPNIIDTLARTAQNLASEHELLCRDPADLAEAIDMSQREALSVSRLAEMPEGLRIYAVRRWLENQTGSLQRLARSHIVSIADLAVSVRSGRVVELPGAYSVEKVRGYLRFKNHKVEK